VEETLKMERLFADRVKKLSEHTMLGVAGSLINSMVLIFVLWDVVNKNWLLLWFLCIILIGVMRVYLQNSFEKFKTNQNTLNKWKNLFLITLAISGVIWGSTGVALFPTESIGHQSFIAFVLGGMVAGTVGVFSVMLRAFLAFSIPALLPIVLRFYLISDPIHFAMGIMVTLFWLIMLITSTKLNKDILNYFILKYENINLISDLEAEVEMKKTAETKLKEQYKEIERIVNVRTSELQDANIKLIKEVQERKLIANALQESEEKYRDLVENINDVIYSVDINGIVTYVSPAVESIIGYKPSEIIGKKFFGFIHPEDLQLIINRFKAVLAGEFEENEYRLLSKSGEYRWIRSSSRSIYKDGRVYGLRGALIDISERKRFEIERAHLETRLQQAQKMESIGTLAGGIAHDFNNILGIILGNIELAIDDVPEWNPARINLEEVRTASSRAKDVVRQLLSFARKTMLEKKPTNIAPIVEESLKLLRSSIPTSIEFRQNITKDVDTILSDTTQINQVLINLCTNADHAMPDGGILEVSLENRELDEDTAAQFPDLNPGRYVNLIVSDTGYGIPKDKIDRIFDPYFTTKDVGKGTGMGLAVVHGIVKGHNGNIKVESKLGKGTTFNIFFPVIGEAAVEKTETIEELPTGDERIILIDDEVSILRLGHQRLERLGYKVESTTSPIEALNLFRSQPEKFDLLITDLTMPKMTGDQLVKEILNIRPDLPIILCTGFSERIDEKKSKEIGVADYIEKPLDKRDFAFRVRKVLDGKKG